MGPRNHCYQVSVIICFDEVHTEFRDLIPLSLNSITLWPLRLINNAGFLSDQIFSYLIVIDFESTCWRDRNNHSQEISECPLLWRHVWTVPIVSPNNICPSFTSCRAVEFPAVVMNTSTGEIESEFHTYVQPQEHPVLSEFCTELTGITQVNGHEYKPRQEINTCASHLTSSGCPSHRFKLRRGSPFRSVFLGSAAGCKTCSLRWGWSFPAGRRDLLHLRKNSVLSSRGQVKVNFSGLHRLVLSPIVLS